MIGRWNKEVNRLAFVEIASQLAPCIVEFRLVVAEVNAILADLFQISSDFLAVFQDLGFARAVAQVAPKFHAIFAQLSVIFAKLGPAVAYFLARATDVSEVVAYLRPVMMAAIIVAAVLMMEARIGMPIIAPVGVGD